MTRRLKIWRVGVAVFIVINFVGGVMAAVQGELIHASVHAGLLLLGVYYVRRIWRRGGAAITSGSRELTESLTNLERSVGAIAIEVERIGEGQRFITRLFTEGGAAQGHAEANAEMTDINARKAPGQ